MVDVVTFVVWSVWVSAIAGGIVLIANIVRLTRREWHELGEQRYGARPHALEVAMANRERIVTARRRRAQWAADAGRAACIDQRRYAS